MYTVEQFCNNNSIIIIIITIMIKIFIEYNNSMRKQAMNPNRANHTIINNVFKKK